MSPRGNRLLFIRQINSTAPIRISPGVTAVGAVLVTTHGKRPFTPESLRYEPPHRPMERMAHRSCHVMSITLYCGNEFRNSVPFIGAAAKSRSVPSRARKFLSREPSLLPIACQASTFTWTSLKRSKPTARTRLAFFRLQKRRRRSTMLASSQPATSRYERGVSEM